MPVQAISPNFCCTIGLPKVFQHNNNEIILQNYNQPTKVYLIKRENVDNSILVFLANIEGFAPNMVRDKHWAKGQNSEKAAFYPFSGPGKR